MLTAEYTSVCNNQTLLYKRNERSLIPIIGQLISALFGTVSETDIEDINRNIKALANNQEQIMHDLDVNLSVLKSKKISNDLELIQSDPISCPQNQKAL